MKRVLRFDGGDPRHVQYRLLLDNALQSRGSKANDPQHKPTKEDRRSEARIQEQLNLVSVVDEEQLAMLNKARQAQGAPALEAPEDDLAPDPRPKTLHPDGGMITLQQTDHTLLSKYVSETAWQSQYSRLSVALEDWLEAAEKVEDGEAKPELKMASSRGRKASV